jgi:hypothetical protein
MMDYNSKIAELEKRHTLLDNDIDKMERNHPGVEQVRVATMKKERLAIKDEISRLRRLAWEETYERVDFSDDR